MDPSCQFNHVVDWDSAKLVEKETDWKTTGIKEAIVIRSNPSNMNSNDGCYHLPYIYDVFPPL